MKTVTINVKSSEKASRLELFIRIVWVLLCGIVLFVAGIFATIAIVLQWFHILILGKRQMALNKFATNWMAAFASLTFYKNLSTDERPPLVPEF